MVEVSLALAAQEGGEEGGEKMLMRKVNRWRSSALNPIFDEINITFENWRLGGQYVDSYDLMDEFNRVCERKVSELKKSSLMKTSKHARIIRLKSKTLRKMQKSQMNGENISKTTLVYRLGLLPAQLKMICW